MLITTRLRPAPAETRDGTLLQGCREEELVQLQPADAVAFFRAQGIRGGRAEIEAAGEPYGYHPLSLRLLAGLIVGDLQQPGDIAAAPRSDVSSDLVQRQHHVLEQAYASLSAAQQNLLSRIACFRSPVSHDALKSLSETKSHSDALVIGGSRTGQKTASLDADLRGLVARGLLHRDISTNRFDLHPIVRRYAYDRLAAPDRIGAHSRLRDYFAAVPEPDKVCTLIDLAPVIELYHHTVMAGHYDEACKLFYDRLDKAIYYRFGAYQLHIDLLRSLFPSGEDRVPCLKNKSAQAWVLNGLANSYSISGQPRRAVPLFARQIAIRKKHNTKAGVITSLGNLAIAQVVIGALRLAEANLRGSIAQSLKIEDKFLEAVGHQSFGWLLVYRGVWVESKSELATALEMFAKHGAAQWQSVVWSNRALLELVRLRRATASKEVKSNSTDLKSAIAPARRSLELADEATRIEHSYERDYVRAHWLLGAAHRVADDLDEAEHHLHEALERCRRINNVEAEADILIDSARLRLATAEPDEAQHLAEEALIITERSGYVLQGADAHLVLAQLAKDRGDLKELREHASEALRLATCDGPPDYTYKAAYDEVSALLR